MIGSAKNNVGDHAQKVRMVIVVDVWPKLMPFKIPIMMVIAHDDARLMTESLRVGADNFVVKSVDHMDTSKNLRVRKCF